jgi:radical SAM protein with 4Fe4S-binding SPASM domain
LNQTTNRANSIFMLHADIVHGCQLRCVGCPNSTIMDKVQRVSVEDFALILGNIDVDHVHTLRLYNFGEPLLHKNLPGIVELIPQQSWKASIVEITTNAQYCDWDNFEEMLKLQVVNNIVVSCDGDGTAESYERLRPPSKWPKLLEFLERTKALKEKWSPATQLFTRSIVENKQERQAWRELVEPMGWTPQFRGWMILPGAATNPTHREPVQQKGLCFFLQNADVFKNHGWHGQVNLLYVDADGTVVPCCIHPQAGKLGNLKHQTYNEILHGSLRAQFQRRMETDRASMSICGNCEFGPAGAEGPSFAAAN